MERSFLSPCGEMSCAKGAYLHMYIGAWAELNMYICIKSFFCPTGSPSHEPVAHHGLSEMLDLIAMCLTSLRGFAATFISHGG